MAVSDLIVVKAVFTGIVKGGIKGLIKLSGSQTWDAHRKWLTNTGVREFSGQNFHHWLLEQNRGLGEYVPDWIKNQRWNLMPMERSLHTWLHNGAGTWEKLWYGTPTWFKAVVGSAFGRVANAFRDKK